MSAPILRQSPSKWGINKGFVGRISSFDGCFSTDAKVFTGYEQAVVENRVYRGSHQFNVAVDSYFQWVENGFEKIECDVKDGRLYLINDTGKNTKEYGMILGMLEAIGCITFEMLGGANSQIYIYINQIQTLKNILNAPQRYQNRLLNAVAERHLVSVKMLTYLYEGDFENEEMWTLLEDYFLGNIPEQVKRACKLEKPDMIFDS